MFTSEQPSVSFAEADARRDRMHSAIENWLRELADLVEEARATEEFQAWLDMQAQFHEYSYRNTLLIRQQCPEATKVAGYRTWQAEFDRHVEAGEQAIWIWAPIIAKRCPECENSPSYHEDSDCQYDETPPAAWSEGLVGFKPAPVFDVSQTAGEPLPELPTAASGEAEDLVDALVGAAEPLALQVRVVEPADWAYGPAKGRCQARSNRAPIVEVKARENAADLASTLIHEYAHRELHIGVEEDGERAKREVEAEAVAYVVGRYFGLDTSNAAFYLAAWQGEAADALGERLERISSVAATLIDTVEGRVGSSAKGV